MRGVHFISLFLCVVLLGGLTAGLAHAAPDLQTNRLVNPSFEGTFEPSGVATGWAHWVSQGSPTFQQISTSVDPRRVREGSKAQMATANFASYTAGLQQTVYGLTPGVTYRFTIWVHAWASSADDPTRSEGFSSLNLRAGIGQGVTFAADPGIKWSAPQNIVDNYAQLSVETVAQGGELTVFTFANPVAELKHNDIYWDDASLVEVGSAAPTPPPPAPTLGLAPTDFPTPTPDANGQIVYIVQPGDSLVRIATVSCGETPQCVEQIKQLNNLTGNTIFVGQRLIIGPLSGVAAPRPTSPPAPTATAGAGEAATPVEAATADGAAATAQPTEVAEGGEDPENITPVTGAGAGEGAASAAGQICVTLYEDVNGNGVLDSGEGFVGGGFFTLYDASTSARLDNYTTDGASEPYCFGNLESGNYRITSDVPEGYTPTTRVDWDLTLAAGSIANLEFGTQLTGQLEGDEAGGSSRVTTALLGAAGIIFLLLAAGVAGYLVLTRRR